MTWYNTVNQASQNLFGRLTGQLGGVLSAGTQSNLGQGLRDVGGQLTGGYRTFNIVPTAYASGGVLGESTNYTPQDYQQSYDQNQYIPQATTTTSAPSGGGGQTPSGGGGEDPNAALWAEIDNIYNSAMGYASGLEAQASANQPGIESEIEAQAAASKQTGEAEKAVGERTIAQEEVGTGKTKESALSAGRRLYNELSLAGQGRFGGASSAGQAYGELTGREFQRGQADVWTKFQTAMSKITDLKANLQERWDAFTTNLETQKNAALGEARRQFQEKLSEINSLKYQAGENRSTDRLNVLQNLRNQIFQINLATAQTSSAAQQQIQQNQQYLSQLESQVNQNMSSVQGAGQQLASTTTTNPQTMYQVGGTSQVAQPTYTGIKRKEEEYV